MDLAILSTGIERGSVDQIVACFSMIYSPTWEELIKTYGKLYDLLGSGGTLNALVPDPHTIDRPLHNGFRSFPGFPNGKFDYALGGRKYRVHFVDRWGEVASVLEDVHWPEEDYMAAANAAGFDTNSNLNGYATARGLLKRMDIDNH